MLASVWVLQALLLQLSPSALDWAQWAGLLVPPDPDPDTGNGAGALERLLRIKCLLLVAVALKLRAFRCGGLAQLLNALLSHETFFFNG